MSRVFEALTKAREAKRPQSEWRAEEVESIVSVETTVEAKTLPPEQYSRANGAVSKTNGAVHETHELYPEVVNGEKSWSEKIEEWLLGWGLQRYNGYLIVRCWASSCGIAPCGAGVKLKKCIGRELLRGSHAHTPGPYPFVPQAGGN